MGARCWGCGEKFGRCYTHGGSCPDDCDFGKHDCPGDEVTEVNFVPAPADMEW